MSMNERSEKASTPPGTTSAEAGTNDHAEPVQIEMQIVNGELVI